MTPLVKSLLLAGITAAGQIGILGSMIMSRAAILRDGFEVALKTEPYDPRDLLRGTYVRLNYAISRLPATLFSAEDKAALDSGAAVRVHLVQGADGLWIADKAALGKGADGADRAWILGHVVYADALSPTVEIAYGIERFYAPESEAPQIEQRMREGEASTVIAAIGKSGAAQIKALKQDSEMLYAEPLY